MTLGSNSKALRFCFALRALPGVGPARLRRFLPQLRDCRDWDYGEFKEVLELNHRELPSAFNSEKSATAGWDRAASIVDACDRHGISVRVLGWDNYPHGLTRLKDPPVFLFIRGPLTSHHKLIAIIGTRHPTEWGLRTARECARIIVKSGGGVVSGLALGIDAEAQQATVDHKGHTIAVLAHGLDVVHPAANRELADQILATGGAWVSEYPPGEPPRRSYFVERDRIQAGLSDALIVIETGVSGGSMHTIRFAKDLGIPMWATFPEEQMEKARSNPDTLAEPQQGILNLLNSKTVNRVSSPGHLGRLLQELHASSHHSARQEPHVTPELF